MRASLFTPSTLAIKWEQPLGKAKHKIDYKIIQIYMQIETSLRPFTRFRSQSLSCIGSKWNEAKDDLPALICYEAREYSY